MLFSYLIFDSVLSEKGTRHETTWDDFIYTYLSNPEEKADKKEYKLFLGAITIGNGRKLSAIKRRSFVVLDYDKEVPIDFPQIVGKKLANSTFYLYTTWSHTPDDPHYRLIIPLPREIEQKEYEQLIYILILAIGVKTDNCSKNVNQLMYLPGRKKGVTPKHYKNTNKLLNIDELFVHFEKLEKDRKTAEKIKQEEFRLELKRDRKKHETEDEKTMEWANENKQKASTIFPDISKFIDKHLRDIYVKVRNGRYKLRNSTSTAGLTVNDAKTKVYSYHNNSDPISDRCPHDVYDLIKIHLCNNGTDADTIQWIDNCKEYKKRAEDSPEKISLALDRHEKTKAILHTEKNLKFILKKDAKIKDLLCYDDFSQEYRLTRDFYVDDTKANLGATMRLDDHSLNMISRYITSSYQIKLADNVIHHWVYQKANKNIVNAVKDYIEKTSWDGVDRLGDFLHKAGAKVWNCFTKVALQKWMVAGLRFIYEENVQFDNVLILQGLPGSGKTTVFTQLATKAEWYGQFKLRTLEDKPEYMYQRMQSKLICDFGELKIPKGDYAESFKNLTSLKTLDYKRPYGHAPKLYWRRFLLSGTTQKNDLYNDEGVARRMWIIPIEGKVLQDKKEFFDLLQNKNFIQQCWAQALFLYNNDFVVDLNKEEEEARVNILEGYKEEDPWNEELLEWAESHNGCVEVKAFLEKQDITRKMEGYQRHARKVASILSTFEFERIRPGKYVRKNHRNLFS